MKQSPTLWEILVPVCDNEGNKYDISYHKQWDGFVRSFTIGKGITIFKSARGVWVAIDGEEHEEKMIPVRVYCSDESIQKIVDFTGYHYKQKAVMYYRVSENIIVKHF
jgi:hypothetical protein